MPHCPFQDRGTQIFWGSSHTQQPPLLLVLLPEIQTQMLMEMLIPQDVASYRFPELNINSYLSHSFQTFLSSSPSNYTGIVGSRWNCVTDEALVRSRDRLFPSLVHKQRTSLNHIPDFSHNTQEHENSHLPKCLCTQALRSPKPFVSVVYLDELISTKLLCAMWDNYPAISSKKLSLLSSLLPSFPSFCLSKLA